jgi:uncharacterized membrane protein
MKGISLSDDVVLARLIVLLNIAALILTYSTPILMSHSRDSYFWIRGPGLLLFGLSLSIAIFCHLVCFYLLLKRQRNTIFWSCIFLILALFPIWFYAAPIQSWDATSGWYGLAYMVWEACKPNDCSFFIEGPSHMADYLNRHPQTLFWFNSLAISVQKATGMSLLAVPVWQAWIASCIAILTLMNVKHLSLKALCAILYWSMAIPLIENHVLLYGYGELVLGAAVLAATSAYSNLAKGPFSIPVFVFGSASVLMVTQIKNSGEALALSLLCSYAVIELLNMQRTKSRPLPLRILMLIVLVLFALIGFEILSVAWTPDSIIISYGGYDMPLKNFYNEIGGALHVAAFKNNSFSIVFCSSFLLAVIGSVLKSRSQNERHLFIIALFHFSVCLSYLAMTSNGYEHFKPNNDTFGSRLLILPVFILFGFMAVSISNLILWLQYEIANDSPQPLEPQFGTANGQ